MAGPQTSFYSRGIQVIFPGHLAPNYSPRIHTKSGPKNGTAFWPKNGSTKGEAPQWGITFCGPVFGPESGPVFGTAFWSRASPIRWPMHSWPCRVDYDSFLIRFSRPDTCMWCFLRSGTCTSVLASTSACVHSKGPNLAQGPCFAHRPWAPKGASSRNGLPPLPLA